MAIDLVMKTIVSDITADFVLLIFEDDKSKSQAVVGKVIVPISALLKVKKMKKCYQILPSSEHEGLSFRSDSYRARPKEVLGYIDIEMDLSFNEPISSYYFKPGNPQTRTSIRNLMDVFSTFNESAAQSVAQSLGANDSNYTQDLFEINDAIRRLSRILRPPPVFIHFLRFPEVFVLIALYWYACFGLSLYHIPLVLFAFQLGNGLLAASERSYEHVRVWTTPVSSRSRYRDNQVSPNSSTQNSLPVNDKDNIHQLHRWITRCVVFFETFSNTWNFSDPQITVLAYKALFAISMSFSILLAVFPTRLLMFICGAIVLLSTALSTVISDILLSNSGFFEVQEESQGKEENKENQDSSPLVTKFRKFVATLRSYQSLISKVPNQVDLDSRYIASSCEVTDPAIIGTQSKNGDSDDDDDVDD